MTDEHRFSLEIKNLDEFAFETDFGLDGQHAFLMDEPEPVGRGRGPNAARLLAAAVGKCLSASLVFCLKKAKYPLKELRTFVDTSLSRNELGKMRVSKIVVHIQLELDGIDVSKARRCLSLFEDYCIVSATVKMAIPIQVIVSDTSGNALYESVSERETASVMTVNP